MRRRTGIALPIFYGVSLILGLLLLPSQSFAQDKTFSEAKKEIIQARKEKGFKLLCQGNTSGAFKNIRAYRYSDIEVWAISTGNRVSLDYDYANGYDRRGARKQGKYSWVKVYEFGGYKIFASRIQNGSGDLDLKPSTTSSGKWVMMVFVKKD